MSGSSPTTLKPDDYAADIVFYQRGDGVHVDLATVPDRVTVHQDLLAGGSPLLRVTDRTIVFDCVEAELTYRVDAVDHAARVLYCTRLDA